MEARKPGARPTTTARIGQLLGKAKRGSHHSVTTEGRDVDKDDRSDFRILAHALEGQCDPPVTEDDWRTSRRTFVWSLLWGGETHAILGASVFERAGEQHKLAAYEEIIRC